MKINSIGATIVAIVLSSIYYGCVVVGDRTFFNPKAAAAIAALDESAIRVNRAKLNKLLVEIDTGECQASIETDVKDPDGRVKTKTITILSTSDNRCAPDEPTEKLTELLVVKTKSGYTPIKSIGAVQFTLDGSCRYCWANSAGGMTCIKSPNPCP